MTCGKATVIAGALLATRVLVRVSIALAIAILIAIVLVAWLRPTPAESEEPPP